MCPVNCVYEGANKLGLHPDECTDFGVCAPECPPRQASLKPSPCRRRPGSTSTESMLNRGPASSPGRRHCLVPTPKTAALVTWPRFRRSRQQMRRETIDDAACSGQRDAHCRPRTGNWHLLLLRAGFWPGESGSQSCEAPNFRWVRAGNRETIARRVDAGISTRPFIDPPSQRTGGKASVSVWPISAPRRSRLSQSANTSAVTTPVSATAPA